MKILQYPPQFSTDDMVINDHFTHVVTGDLWTITATDSGTATVGDEAGGVLTLAPSDGTVADNDQIYLSTTNEIFLVADETPIYAEIDIKFTEANTDDANVAFGFMDGVAAESIVDDGAGPKASYSGAVIFKVDGSNVWQCESSVGTAQTTTTTTSTAGGAAWQRLGILIQPASTGDTAEVTFTIDGQPFRDSNNNTVKHSLDYSSITNMDLFVGAKNGSANNESIKVDMIRAYQGVTRP